eukprot:maker-scaffold_47-snap-gene-0.52-mRNA-1 protein AED:0.13 eAED:0.13 QI:1914/1/1/1/0.5/0.4/5/240/675
MLSFRDLKPMNLFITEFDILKIADFGTAKIIKRSATPGASRNLLDAAGTPAFMAPELLLGESADYDAPPVDIWSSGATLFMFVTGKPPWNSPDEMTLRDKVRHEELIFPENFNSTGYSPHLRNLISQMLVKDHKKRPNLTAVMTHDWVTDEGTEPLWVDADPMRSPSSPPAVSPIKISPPFAIPRSGASVGVKTTLHPVRSFRDSKKMKRLSSRGSLLGQALVNSSSFYQKAMEEDSDEIEDNLKPQISPMKAGEKEDVVGDGDDEDTEPSLEKDTIQSVQSLEVSKPPSHREGILKGSKSLYNFGHKTRFASSLEHIGLDPNALSPGSSNPTTPGGKNKNELAISSIDPFSLFQEGRRVPELSPALQKSKRRRSFLLELLKGTVDGRENPIAAELSIQGIRSSISLSSPFPLIYGASSTIGTRRSQEDRISVVHEISLKQKTRVFFAGLFDGFGGEIVSTYVSEHLPEQISQLLLAQDGESVPLDMEDVLKTATFLCNERFLKRACRTVIRDYQSNKADILMKSFLRTRQGNISRVHQYQTAGSTGVFLTVRPVAREESKLEISYAWLGDSRIILSRKGEAVQLTEDHVCSRDDEKKRIRSNGGQVTHNNRLNGNTIVSRGFGGMSLICPGSGEKGDRFEKDAKNLLRRLVHDKETLRKTSHLGYQAESGKIII